MAATEATVSIDKIKRRRAVGKGRNIDLGALNDVRELLGDAPRQRDLLIEHLHKIQDHYQHISSRHLVALAHEMNLATTEVYEVATFYHHFDIVKDNDTPPPPLTVRVCESVSCEMAGAGELIDALSGALGDQVRVQPVPCVGRCQHAPVAVVGMNPIDSATEQTVLEATHKQAVIAPVTDYISYTEYKNQQGYALLNACYDGKHEPLAIRKIMEDSGLRGLGVEPRLALASAPAR